MHEERGVVAPAILLAIVLSITAAWATLWLEPLHPAQLWTLPWALATDLYVLRLLPYRPLSWATALLAVCATVAFVAATTTTGRRTTVEGKAKVASRSGAVQRAAVICGILTLLLLAAFLAQAIHLYGVRGALISPAPLRTGIGKAEFTVTIKYIYFAIATAGLSAFAAASASSWRPRVIWLVMTAAAVASTYFATGRATIVDAAIVGVVAFALGRPTLPKRRSFVFGVGAILGLALVVFLVGGAIIGKTYSNNPGFRLLPSVFSRHHYLSDLALPYEYASAPIAALDVQVLHSTAWGDGYGCAALHVICTGLRHLGMHVPSIPTVRPFTAAPLPWNTYTALDAPLIDGGRALVTPVIAFLGLLLGWIWRWARRGALAATIIYSVEAVGIVTSVGSFNFLAPFLVGSCVVALLTVWVGNRLPRLRWAGSALGSSRSDPDTAADA